MPPEQPIDAVPQVSRAVEKIDRRSDRDGRVEPGRKVSSALPDELERDVRAERKTDDRNGRRRRLLTDRREAGRHVLPPAGVNVPAGDERPFAEAA